MAMAADGNEAAMSAALRDTSLAAQHWRLERRYWLISSVIFCALVPFSYGLVILAILHVHSASSWDILGYMGAGLPVILAAPLLAAFSSSYSRRNEIEQWRIREAAIAGDETLAPLVQPQPWPLTWEERQRGTVQSQFILSKNDARITNKRYMLLYSGALLVDASLLAGGFVGLFTSIKLDSSDYMLPMALFMLFGYTLPSLKWNEAGMAIANRDGLYWQRKFSNAWKYIPWTQIRSVTCSLPPKTWVEEEPLYTYVVDAGDIILTWRAGSLQIGPLAINRPNSDMDTLLRHIVARSGKPLRDVTAATRALPNDDLRQRRRRMLLGSVPLLLYMLLIVVGVVLRVR